MVNIDQIKCPTCNKPNTWHPDNNSRPFCSERCKLIDLGEWADEGRKIPGNINVSNSDIDSDASDD